jgi:3-methyladenine DNA glycosylase AlkD
MNAELTSTLLLLTDQFSALADPKQAQGMKKYMKDLFPFLGIKKPIRSAAEKACIAECKKLPYDQLHEFITALWQKEEREYQYCALVLMEAARMYKHEKSIELFEKLITTKSWWDTVDAIASKCVGGYFKAYPIKKLQYIERWMNGNNLWLQRTCLIFQLSYREKTDVELLFGCIDATSKSKEFFLQKAIGWALRQYARTNPSVVFEFVNNRDLKPLSRREALKHFT